MHIGCQAFSPRFQMNVITVVVDMENSIMSVQY